MTRLLIVDDTDHVRRMLVDILTLHGFQVVGQARNGAEAVDEVARTTPDVVVMDYRMPKKDGVEATREIRAARPNQAVVLYSAYVDEALETQAKDAGVSVCVPKVSGVEALATEISALLMDLGDAKVE